MSFFKSYSDAYFKAVEHSDGFYYAIGKCSISSSRALLMKLDNNGEVIFSKSFAVSPTGFPYRTWFNDLLICDDGNILLQGSVSALFGFILKVSSTTGDIIWIKGHTNLYYHRIERKILSIGNDKYIVPYFYTTEGVPNRKGGVLVFDTNGNISSFKNLGLTDTQNSEIEYSVSVDSIATSPSKNKLLFIYRTQALGGIAGTVCLLVVTDLSFNVLNSVELVESSDSNQYDFLSGEFINENEICFKSQSRRTGSIGDFSLLLKWDWTLPVDTASHINGVSFRQLNRVNEDVVVANNKIYVNVASDYSAEYDDVIAVFDKEINLLDIKGLDLVVPTGTELYSVNRGVKISSFDGTNLVNYVNTTNSLLVTDTNLTSPITVDGALELSSISPGILPSSIIIGDTNPFEWTSRDYDVELCSINVIDLDTETYLDLNQSTILTNNVTIDANGQDQATITVQLKDQDGLPLSTGGPYSVNILTTAGTLLQATGLTNPVGVYSTQLTSSTNVEVATLSFTVDGSAPSTNTVDVAFEEQVISVSLSQSSIEASLPVIPVGGAVPSIITVQLREPDGTPITTGTYTVVIENGGVGTLSNFTQVNPGKYTMELRSSNIEETAILRFRVGNSIADDTDTVFFDDMAINPIEITGQTSFQSSAIYLQAAGSDGADSTEGRHLRWAFRGALGENHLPKGNLTSVRTSFNKPDDFVRIYRAPYAQKSVYLNFLETPPAVIDNSNHLWIYRIQRKEFYVTFANGNKYDQVSLQVDPSLNPSGFFQLYGNELIEVECKNDLFFAATLSFTQVQNGGTYQGELLSVNDDRLTAHKTLSVRQSLDAAGMQSPVRILCENGRVLRGIGTNAILRTIGFEFYLDTIDHINNLGGWTTLGDFSLSLNEAQVFQKLEPNAGDVHGHWQRFNDDAFVNIQNYKDKWNAPPELGDRNIKTIVENYITLSNDPSNPAALEDVPLGNDPSDPTDVMTVSHLDLLTTAAYDYHIARMLGMGVLDTDNSASASDAYCYVMEYHTMGDMGDGLGARDIHHLYMSLPTSNLDQRLPEALSLREIIPGVFSQSQSNNPTSLSDDDGYAHNGLSRFISLFANPLTEDETNKPFFNTNAEVDRSMTTDVIYAGIEYKGPNDAAWVKPEIANDDRYTNAVPAGQTPHFESRYINIPDDQTPLYTHRQRESGTHTYGSYGINWFSRAALSPVTLNIDSTLQPKTPLAPPSNTTALLIREEGPRLLTSEEEQIRFGQVAGTDKTLIRLAFNYHGIQDVRNYQLPLGSTVSDADIVNPANANDASILFPDNQDSFANKVDIFFRGSVPQNITGKTLSATDHPTEYYLSVIQTGPYDIVSQGEQMTITPTLVSGTEDNYVGGAFVLGDHKYVIYEVTADVQGPKFTVYKKAISDAILSDGMAASGATDVAPIEIPADGLFMAIENMQNPEAWGAPNPLDLEVQIGDNWPIHREVITPVRDNGTLERHVEKSRGIWDEANVEAILEPIEVDASGQTTLSEHKGLYAFTFNQAQLNQHPQFVDYTTNPDSNTVEWYGGSIRVFTQDSFTNGKPNKSRKVLSVLRIENIGAAGLKVYAQDPTFSGAASYDAVITGTNISTNFYPGYKVYVYANPVFGLTEQVLLPAEGESMRNSIFGFRSRDSALDRHSKISIPAIMFAQELVAAETPQLPQGPLYATRPDFFGRATYTFTTEYTHKPHGVLFYRSNEEALLHALYERSTVEQIRQALKPLGGNDELWATDRWTNFLDFDTLEIDGDFAYYPPTLDAVDRFKFPNPDKQALFTWINEVREGLGLPVISGAPGTLVVTDPQIFQFIKGAIFNAFVPLTEVPIVYEQINGSTYTPVDKKQTLRDKNGLLLQPTHPDFDMAPMMKVVGTSPHSTQFTDFKLDGTSKNLYFYAAKELSSRLHMSSFSPVLGPIKLVNTNPPEAPEIKRIMPVLENEILGIQPKVQLEINSYPEIQNVTKLTVYRTTDRTKASSVRTMDVAQVIDVTTADYENEAVWKVYDRFSDLDEVPYGSPLYYRITASRAVQYADKNDVIVDDFAPSKASKITGSLMVEVKKPTSPKALYTGTLNATEDAIDGVSMNWTKTVFNGKYHIYKMNSQGNWTKIYEVQSNEPVVTISLLDTDLAIDTLDIKNDNGDSKYHHFKVITENTSGMRSTEENILTIPSEIGYGISLPPATSLGIGDAVIGDSLIVE